jgi:hypothetical protein
MKSEQYFLKYGFSCAEVLLTQEHISEEKYKEIRQNAIKGIVMNRQELMDTFQNAFRRIKEVANKMGKDVWDLEVMKKYFLEEHNKYIDAGDGSYSKFPKTFCELCKVKKGIVIDKNDFSYKVNIDGKEMNVLSELLPDAQIGDKVTIHHAFAVEKLE